MAGNDGHLKPSKASKRTMIDLSNDNKSSSHITKHHHSKRVNVAKKQAQQKQQQQASKKTIKTDKDGKNTEKFMETWMKNNVANFEKKDKAPTIIKSKSLSLSPFKTEQGKKKQYETDDFRVNSMSDEPMMTPDAPPPIMAPVPNHVMIDNIDEGIHMQGPPPMEEHHEELHHEEPHHEEPHHYHIQHYDPPPYIEEPTYVHHVEPPPPPPPEPVMIPVPIAAPPPPPPPPPPCTVHIPVTIHLKGKLAIKMKHCENCDFSKNIEAIGPLKIGPLNGLKGKSRNVIESQAERAILSATSQSSEDSQDNTVLGSKRNDPPTSQGVNIVFFQRPIADFEEVLAKSESITFDDDFTSPKNHFEGDSLVTKKDITGQRNEPTQLIAAKPVNFPESLLPKEAFKRGVVISLPKGKALLKCVAPVNDTKDSGSTFTTDESSSSLETSTKEDDSKPEPQGKVIIPVQTQPNEATLPATNDVITFSAPSNETRIIKPTSSLSPSPSLNVIPQTSDKKDTSASRTEDLFNGGHKSHKLTDKFLHMFDKDMLISLYKMAVKDILNELQRQKKAHRRSNTIRRRMQILESERTSLENKFPGLSLIPLNVLPTDTITRETASIESGSIRHRRSKDLTSSEGEPRDTKDDIDNADDDEQSITYHNTHGASITVNPQKVNQLNGTRRVKLVDTYRLVKQDETVKPKHTKLRKFLKQRINAKFHRLHKNATRLEDPVPEDASSALSFYGDLDPTKLMDETPQCIDPTCEKHKQFIKHAGQYFQSLDNLALEPYKAFMGDKDKETSESMNQDTSVFEEPYGATVNVQETRWDDVKSTKRQTILDTSTNTPSASSDDPNTIVELFGKLPRVPLKITLNPKGPLARMKKPIEIDLRPPGKGEPASRMIATANDPTVAVHIANKIFKEEPLDPKQEQKLQSVYADIKKRSSIGNNKAIKYADITSAALLNGKKSTNTTTVELRNIENDKKLQQAYADLKRRRRKTDESKSNRRMKIIVSLPKELTKLVAQSDYKSVSRSSNPNGFISLKSNSLPSSTTSTSSEESSPSSPVVLPSKPTYVVGQENEDKLMGKEDSMLKPEIEEYEKKLKKLKEQTNAVMAQYNKLKDPYSDIGKKRRIKTKKRQHLVKHAKYDPYADMGANVATLDKRSNTINSNPPPVENIKNGEQQSSEKTNPAVSTGILTEQQGNNVEKTPSAVTPPSNPNPENQATEEKLPSLKDTAVSTNKQSPVNGTLFSQSNSNLDIPINTTINTEKITKNTDLLSLTESKKPQEPEVKATDAGRAKQVQADGSTQEIKSKELSSKTDEQNSVKPNVDLGSLNQLTGKSNMSAYEEIAQDPYATLGSSVSSLNKRGKVSKRMKRLGKRHQSHHKPNVHNEVNSDKRNLGKLHGKQDVPAQAAISLIRHVPDDISKEVTMEPALHSGSKSTSSNLSEQQAKVEDNPTVKVDTNKPMTEEDKTSVMQAFPKFSEALSKITPETRKKLLNLKPFKFLNKMVTTSIPFNPTGKDPYADMGSEASEASKRKVVSGKSSNKHSVVKKHKMKTENARKRSETYDPYADLGTSIGLNQNEARKSANNETQTVKVSLTTSNSTQTTEDHGDDTTIRLKQPKVLPPLARSDQVEAFTGSSSSHINAYDTVDPYADLGASANRASSTSSKEGKHQDIKEEKTEANSQPLEVAATVVEPTKENSQSLQKADDSVKLVEVTKTNTTDANMNQPITNQQEDQGTPQNITAASAMVQKVQKMIDNDVEHFVGKLKLPERLHEVNKIIENAHNAAATTNEMETGDLNAPNEIMDKLATVEKEIAGENDLATIEKLEKEIASEKEKAEAASFPQNSLLEQNVGKEIQGPYTDMGTKKQKTLGKHRLQRQHKMRDEIATKKSQPYHHTYDEQEEGAVHQKPSDKMEIINRLEAAVRALKRKSHRPKCLPNEDVLKLIKHTGEHVGVNNPYLSIGKEMGETSSSTSKKQYVNPCKLPIIKEDSPTVKKIRHIKASEKSTEKSSQALDPYAEMGTTVRMGEKKKEITKKYDPYEDLGTVSVRKDRIERINRNKHLTNLHSKVKVNKYAT